MLMKKGSNLYSLKFWGHIIYFFEKVWDDRPYLPNGDWFLYLMWEKEEETGENKVLQNRRPLL